MIVGRLELTINIPGAQSLKDKRRVVKSVVSRIRNRYNVAVAEIGDNDKWQICRLGAAVVSNRSDHAHSQLSALVRAIESEREIILIDYNVEVG